MGRPRKINPCSSCGKQVENYRNSFCNCCIAGRVFNKKLNLDGCQSDRTRRKFLIVERGHQCECCRNREWMGKPIPLELDHIDGDSDNNIEENLQLICPNCHALTPYYKGANKGNSKRQVMRRQRYAEGKTF